jgi:hypothetical protein
VFSSSLAHGHDLSQFWVIDSACSINLTAFRSDFVTFDPPCAPSRVGGVGVHVKGSGTARISILLAFGQSINRIVHALYTRDTSYGSAHRVGRLLGVSWMQTQSGCEVVFPIDYGSGLLLVPIGMDVLKQSGNGLYLLPHRPEQPPSPTADSLHGAGSRVALTA